MPADEPDPDSETFPDGVCHLCLREAGELTRHHLIPRTRHKNRRNKRTFSREEVRQRIAMLCRPCHNQLHALFSEKQLERELNTLAALRAQPEVARFLSWIRTRPGDGRVSVKRSRGRRKPRR